MITTNLTLEPVLTNTAPEVENPNAHFATLSLPPHYILTEYIPELSDGLSWGGALIEAHLFGNGSDPLQALESEHSIPLR